ncbi:MAG TPA: TIR domain-containing protein, partial [Gemmataceae bacterium]|nr:TIR domain-containing protein [Gemmataceae bacterium]
HGEGLIHRDIKPGNILYLRGHAKVADLGLVKLSPEQDHASAAKSVAGTQPYMPREAMKGKATGASDQFSLAVTYAELRLGEPLHPEGDRTQVWLPYLGDRPDLSGLSRAERRAVARALAPDPLKRYKTCRELAGALQAAVEAAGWWRPLLRKFQGRGAPAETADSPTRDGDFRVPEAPAPAAESHPAPARDAPPPTTQRPHIVGTQAYAGEESPARREEGLSGVGDGMVRAAPASRRVRIVALAGLGLSLAALLITTAFMAFRDQHTGPEAPAISPAGNPGFTAFWGYAFSMVSVLGLAVAAAFLTVTVLRRSRSREGKSLAVVCPECNNVLPHDQVDKRLKRGNDSIRCIVCDTHIRFRPPAPKTVIKPPHPAPGTVRSPDVPTDRMFEFDVFLAHNNKDKPEVKATCQALKDCGLKPWLDVEQIPPGTFFQDVIQQGIARSMSAVVFLGLEGTGTFQAMELRAIIGKFVNTGRRVIPVLLPGVKEIPEELLFLQELHYVRFAKRMDEPEAIEQLLWGITGRRPQADPAEVVPPSPAADGAAPPGE